MINTKIQNLVTGLHHSKRSDIRPGCLVDIVLKKDQKSGILTRGIVDRLLTSKAIHTRGIKVRLKDGRVGRVQKIIRC
jgi:uncharacterized repeat protein (TIGR03833 family)